MRRVLPVAAALTLLAGLVGVAPGVAAERPASVRTEDRAVPARLAVRAPTKATDLLTWRRVRYPRSATVSTNGAWTLAVGDQTDQWVELSGPGMRRHWDVPDGTSYVGNTYLDDHWAVFGVYRSMSGKAVSIYTVVDLQTGQVRRVDRHLTGKALYVVDYLGGRLLVTTRRAGQWCLGYVDLATRALTDGPCPQPATEFASPRLTDDGLSVGQFDPGEDTGDRGFSCVTLLDLSGDLPAPFPHTKRCWPRDDALVVAGGTFWSERIRPDLPSYSRFRAVADDTLYRLGTGDGNSAVWCHGAAYFVPRATRHGSTVARWDGSGVLTTVYRDLGYVSYLRCGGDHLTLTADDEDRGARQLTASLR